MEDKRAPGRPSTRIDGRQQKSRPEIPQEIIQIMSQSNIMGDFYIDESKIPENTRYNWKRLECVGKQDVQYQVMLQRRSWVPVNGGRHPEAGGKEGEPIIIKGLILMECPEHIANYFDEFALQKNDEAIFTQEKKMRDPKEGAAPGMPRMVTHFSRTMGSGQQPIPA